MRIRALSIVMMLSVGACEREESPTGGAPEPSAAPVASASAAATTKASAKVETEATATARLAPRFGGSVVLVGDHAVELVLHRSGKIQAQVRTAGGELVTDAMDAKLGVVASGTASVRPKVELAWSAPQACFAGEATGGVELVPGPVDVSLEIGGKVAQATLAEVALVVDPAIGGSIMVAGNHSVELVAGVDGDLEAILRDAAGLEVKADASTKLEAKLAATAAAPTVTLAWDGPRARFAGHVAAGVELVPGPVQVTLDVGGKAAVGGLAKLALSAKALHGGRVVVAGEYSVELLAAAGGEVQAFVFDAQGKAYAQGDLELALGIGADADLKLAWDPPSLSYRAKLKTDVDLSTEPIRVRLVAGGRAFAGAVAGLSADARLAANADLGAAADVKTKADANLGATADAKVGAKAGAAGSARAGARVAVAPPRVDVRVQAPSVRARAGTSSGAKAGSGARASGRAGFSIGTH